MPHTPVNSSDPTIKRRCTELSPQDHREVQGNTMEVTDIIKIIKDTINTNLDEKLKLLATKNDLEEIKAEVSSINTELHALRNENRDLKSELIKAKQENENNKKDIIWLENHINTNKLFFKGLKAENTPKKEVIKILREKLEINTQIKSVRKVFEKNGKMSVIVEFDSNSSIAEVFKNTKKLSGTDISIERDMLPTKQLKKRVSLLLKKKIWAVNKQYKISVREDKIKINEKWFKWNNANKLVSENEDGETALLKLYGEAIKSISLDFDNLLLEINSKN